MSVIILTFLLLYFRDAIEYFRGSLGPGFDEVNAINENTSISDRKKRCALGSLCQLGKASFLQPFLCIGILYLSYNISGYSAVCAYSNDYFKNAGAQGIDYAADSAISGTMKFLLSMIAPFILLRVSKKCLFVGSGLVSAVSFILGDYVAKY